MLTAVLIAAVAATSVAQTAPPPIKLAAPGLTGTQVDPNLPTFCTERLAQRIGARGIEVTTSREMEAVLGLERQKELLACGEGQGSCMAELANALGVDGILIGDVAKLGGTYHLNLKIVDARTSASVASRTVSAAGDEQLVPALDDAADALAEQYAKHLGRMILPPQARESAGASSLSPAKWVVGGVGGALLVGGVVSLAMAQRQLGEIEKHPATLQQAQELRQAGERFEAIGWSGVGLGAAAVAGAAAMHLLTSDAQGSPSASAGLFFDGSSSGLVVQGRFP